MGDNERTAPWFFRAAATINKQVPSLAIFGFSFWAVWNTIAFSGSIWLHDISNLLRAEDLMICHLGSSIVTLVAFGIWANKTRELVTKGWFVWVGAAVACLGTLLIVITREAVLPSETLFLLGGLLAGPGTTVLFVTSVVYLGTLPPRRSLLMLALCSLTASCIYFVLMGIDNALASVCFILLPLASASLLALKPRAVTAQLLKGKEEAPLSSRLIMFLVFLLLCSAAIELARGTVLIGIPPTMSSASRAASQFIDILLFVAVATFILLKPDQYDCAKLYSVATGAVILVVLVVAGFNFQSLVSASIASSACSCFNLTVWAIFAYIVFQADASPFRVFLIGNATLSLGTLFGVLLTLAYFDATWINGVVMKGIFLVLALAILGGLLHFVSAKNIGKLLLPIEQPRLEDDVIGHTNKRPKHWVRTCEAIAQQHGLSKREQEVFVALARGKTPQEIADHDYVSVYTVRAHIRAIYAKLDIHSRKQLLDFIEEHIAQ